MGDINTLGGNGPGGKRLATSQSLHNSSRSMTLVLR